MQRDFVYAVGFYVNKGIKISIQVLLYCMMNEQTKKMSIEVRLAASPSCIAIFPLTHAFGASLAVLVV
jgi:hypothetical protein